MQEKELSFSVGLSVQGILLILSQHHQSLAFEAYDRHSLNLANVNARLLVIH
jgi:hypothetical protein